MVARAVLIAVASIAIAATVAACPPSGAPRPVPPSPTPTRGWEHPDQVGGVKVRDGGQCTTAADCASGVCEGEGCGDGAGTCATTQRACTKDLREYCGCGGVSFQASGSCPLQRFSHAGACRLPDGNACQAGAECESGICEGQGCGADAPGVCVAADRMCAAVVTDFCGCDGKTFQSGSSCAGQRFAAPGSCAATVAKPDGAACLAGPECASGVCEGQGCSDAAPGVCAAKSRRCTRDLRPYCGCDGATFRTSGTCPGRRYHAKGTCPAP